jgi:lysozyme
MAKLDFLLPLVAIGVGVWLVQQYLAQQPDAGYPDVSPEGDTPAAPMSSSITFQTTVPYMQFPASQLQTSQAGRAAIQQFEGRANSAYADPPGSGKYSIGIGHHITGNDGLTPQSVLSNDMIDAIFASDVGNAENVIRKYVTVPLTQGQFDALVDFVFNLGETAFHGSHLLFYLNAGDYNAAANEFNKWVHEHNPAGQLVVDTTLVARRTADTALFIG